MLRVYDYTKYFFFSAGIVFKRQILVYKQFLEKVYYMKKIVGFTLTEVYDFR